MVNFFDVVTLVFYRLLGYGVDASLDFVLRDRFRMKIVVVTKEEKFLKSNVNLNFVFHLPSWDDQCVHFVEVKMYEKIVQLHSYCLFRA